MERARIEQEIAGMLAQMGIRRERLSLAVRLAQDLGIEGDDAADFFAAVCARFGTDLTVLREDWSTYFGPEGLSVVAGGSVVAGAAAAGAAAGLAGLPGLPGTVLAAAGGVAAWLLGRAGGSVRSRPIHLGEVVDAVERGRWERPADG